MTNKVKPFYIRITNEMTPQMVQDAFDKCVNAGARAMESIKGADTKIRYVSFYPMNFRLFGVNNANETSLYDYPGSLGIVAKEITLDQLDEWLGIAGSSPKQVEWKNGDECVFDNKTGREFSDYTLNYLNQNAVVHLAFKNKNDFNMVLIEFDDGHCCAVLDECVSKPETPEQKAERERLEAIKEMAQTPKPCGFSIYDICEQLYDAGYRKQ